MQSRNLLFSGLAWALGTMLTATDLPAQQPAAKAPAIAKEVAVQPGKLSGKILEGGTRAPAEGHTMTLRAADGRELARIATAADGSYATPPLDQGSYVLEVAKGMNLKLNVAPDATIHDLDIVVPKKLLAAAPTPPTPLVPLAPTPSASTLDPPAAPGSAGVAAGPDAAGGAAGARTAGTRKPLRRPATLPPTTLQAGASSSSGATAGTVVGWGLIGVGAAAAIAIPVIVLSGNDDENVVSPSSARHR